MKLPVASHTMLGAFDNCPHKGYRMYIAKDLPREKADAKRQEGRDLHTAMMKHLQTGKVLPDRFREYEHLARPMFAYNPHVEMALAISVNGSPCGFYDDHAYVRGYADVVVLRGDVAIVFDWKTGKRREDPGEIRLHALMLQALHPTVTKITGYYVWLQDNALGKPHDLSDTHVTWARLNEEVDEIKFMLDQGNFPKRPNPLCGWCPVRDCEHNRVEARESNG